MNFKKVALIIYLVIIALLFTASAFCFPEMVRHGYVNCISCHVSPTGGGTLTPYGRQLSKEILSQFGKEGEEQFVYGTVTLPEWLLAGGDLRILQLYADNPSVRQAKYIPMQADLEAAVSYKKVTADATFGPQESPLPTGGFFSRRHYVNYKPSDSLSFRGGRFFPAYGVNLPDHIPAIKRGLGWDENGETYNIEAAFLGDEFNFYVTGIFGRPDAQTLNRETGGAFTGSYAFFDRFKLGASYYYGTINSNQRHLLGPWGILGVTPHLFLLSEVDFQKYQPSDASSGSQTGLAEYQKLDYEIVQGLHAFITQEFFQLDFNNSGTIQRIYGLGIQYFPRPHFEIQGVWERQNVVASFPNNYTDYAWLLFHYYL